MSKNKQAQEKVKFSEKKTVHVFTANHYTTNSDRKWNVICLPLLGCSLLAFGLTLVIVGSVKDIEDLIILGCIFGIGSVVFFFIMYTAVCRPMCQRNIIQTFNMVDKSKDTRPSSNKSTTHSDLEFYNTAFDPYEDLMKAKTRPQPTEDQLYGERMRSFLTTPATTSDVTFYNDAPGTPPPPRLALPSDVGSKDNPVYTMELSKDMTQKSQDISRLELL